MNENDKSRGYELNCGLMPDDLEKHKTIRNKVFFSFKLQVLKTIL